MADLEINDELMAEIAAITTPYLTELNRAISQHWPDGADMYFTLAIGFSLAVLLEGIRDIPNAPATAISGINAVIGGMGAVLVPVH